MTPFSSLTNRIFLANAALAVLCVGAAIYLVNARVAAAAGDELQRSLRQTGALVDEQRATVSQLYAVLARTVADLPKLKAAVATGDPPTVQPIAADYRRAVHADLLLVDDQSHRLLGAVIPAGVVLEARRPLASVLEAHAGREAGMLLPAPAGLLEMISIPITAGAEPPQILGTLTLGFLIDDELARQFKQLTGSDIAFAVDARIVASTLAPAARPALEFFLQAKDPGNRLSVGGEEYIALRRALDSSLPASAFPRGGDTVVQAGGRSGNPTVLILQSRTERLRLLRSIQTALIATGVVAVLLAIALSYGIARTITRPLGVITHAMKQIAATGDLTRKIDWQPSRWDDEDARLLASTFNTLTGSITRFQREAAERERLSALGRLSTVIAHEVRNPLMIIKASLRPLARGEATAAQVREAAADIDEEVQRLSRLTDEVLDFARPLHFDLAPTNVAEVCEASLAAGTAAFGSLSVRLDLDRTIATVTTDAERLRTALVNIVVNACHAVMARRAGQPIGTPADSAAAEARGHGVDVALVTRRHGADRFEIVVRDRGVGIVQSDLSRVFDPYFTTRRAGTGLGLAIARNIIEGLGGTIGVASEPGVGTEVRLELPLEGPQEHTP